MKLAVIFLLPAYIAAQCLSPRNTHLCPQLMLDFSRTGGLNRQSVCFNFCDGVFQNSNTFFFGSLDCVTGCRLSDLPTTPNVAAASTSTHYTTATSGTQVNTAPASRWFPGTQINPNPNVASTVVTTPATAPASWWFPGTQINPSVASTVVTTPVTAPAPASWWFPGTQINPSVASTVVTTPATAPAPASWWFPGTQINPSVASTVLTTPAYTPYVNRVPGPSITGATVTVAGGSGFGTVGSGSVYNPSIGRASITQSVVTGPGGTSHGTVTGAGKAIPFARTTNIAGASIGRTSTSSSSCYGNMGCGKMGSSRSRSSSQSYEALASSITAPSLTTAAAAAASALLLMV